MMKKIFSIGNIIFLLSGIAIAACTKEEMPDQNRGKTFTISVNSNDVRTTLDGKSVLWKASDRVACLLYDSNMDFYSLTTGIAPKSFEGKNAEFEISSSNGLTPRILVNPSADGYSLNRSKNAIQVTIPSEFALEAGKVADTTLYSVGIINDGKAFMKNLFSYFKVEIESDTICKLKIVSVNKEGLSGKVLFDLNTLEVIEGENHFISVIPSDGLTAFTPGIYYIPVPAGTLHEGLQIKFFSTNGMMGKKTSSTSYTIPRNKFIGLGKESELDLQWGEGQRVFDILFSDGTTTYFPFSDKADAKTAVTIPSKASVLGKKVGPYYLVGRPNDPFYFTVMDTGGKTSYFTVQKTYGLRLGGTKYDHILLPPIANLKLIKLYIKEGTSQDRSYCVTDDPAAGKDPQFISAATFSVPKNTDKTVSFTNTKANTAYRLAMPSTNASSIMRLTLTYEVID